MQAVNCPAQLARDLRDFIRDGDGHHYQFLTECKASLNPDGPPGHILTAVANPGGPIIVNLQFFAGCKGRASAVAACPGRQSDSLYVEQASTHFFSYTQEEDGQLTGGEIVALHNADDQWT